MASRNVSTPSSKSRNKIQRDRVVEFMGDGWIILDSQNVIVDNNKSAAKMIGFSQKEMYDKPVSTIFNEFPKLIHMLNDRREFEIDQTVMVNNQYRFLNIRVSQLPEKTNISQGRLIILRDVTERRRAEDVRQQARDEMFVLLNAIASAASQAADIKEFLLDVIFQIVYPFRSQIIIFYILDERNNPKDEEEYYLAAQLGLSSSSSKQLRRLSSSSPMLSWNEENKSHLLLESPLGEDFPPAISELRMASILSIPLTIQSDGEKKNVGALFLGRKEKPAFNQDEIIRLSILADQIAKLIVSDRRRKISIALTERKRLMRDIHDSVSQKIYGLVTTTEAAQAGIEAGAQLDYNQVLSRIGENARQAVKELRLFLYQMQTVDLEKEGLVSVLHHRLAAVEGRADIEVRFITDDPIQISKRKEVALYYIAQEALNNVLRHAEANSVSVNLNQGPKYVTMEISDDGCGFDTQRLDRGGLGLKNIIERVKQENGKLKIQSEPGKGTIIQVKFEIDAPNGSKII